MRVCRNDRLGRFAGVPAATTTIGAFWHEPPMIRVLAANKQS
jgi:hypothetical protein